MALFQKSVLNQYLKSLDKSKVEIAYQKFKAHFHNTTIQQQIRESKEEQYQEGFFRDLFVDVFGYTLNPQPNFNLTTELKNETNNKKVDGAILKDSNAIAVIELKGTNTTDLATVASQAFGYKNNQKDCKYVIISNFEKLRFYIDNAIDFEEFNLFTLTESEFNVLYLCLHIDNIFSDLPATIKQASTVKEQDITKQLYKDYSDFKRKLFADIVQLNPQYDKLILFKKSQKLLDRILFILFAEDRGLLQANTIQTILDEFENLKKLDAYQPLYERFKKHFTYLNNGFKNEKYEVFGYNGGLFANDEILDNILISDNLLLNYTPTLAKYDYETDVDVNILGHIFEHSLNDIEEIQAELDGTAIDKTKTKRKKDGVFYTPKYITKYIVENTVGALCNEKRTEFEIIADSYTPDKRKAKKKELLQKLDNYQNWLLQITIVDPACGSGAFLNQALDFLIQEHKNIDELRAQLLGESMVLPDHEVAILENNIFGVDLNEESVEIARLSLWLRTARKGRKLNSLNNNIKCGNSLIDDATIAGEKAFNWQNEFPKIFTLLEKETFHITCVMHNTRTSERMRHFNVEKGQAEYLLPNEEEKLTEIIVSIFKQDKLNILEYNICADHVHFLIVCEEEKLSKIIQKIKAKSAREFNIWRGITVPMTSEHAHLHEEKRGTTQNHLWAQKYNCVKIESDKQLWNTIEYIRNNRNKHELQPLSNGACSIVQSALCTEEYAYRTEYNGGFDVVIGNPPYVRSRELFNEKEKQYYLNNFSTISYQIDLYKMFIEKSCKLLNINGALSFITPSVFLTNDYDKPLRKFLLDNYSITSIASTDNDIFSDASVKAVVFSLINKLNNSDIDFYKIENSIFCFEKSINQDIFINQNYLINEKVNSNAIPIISKLNSFNKVDDFFEVKNGIKVRKELLAENKINEDYKSFILGKNILAYWNSYDGIYIHYKIENEKLYTNQAFRNKEIFEQEKLITRQILGNRIITSYDINNFFTDQTTYVINKKSTDFSLKYLLCLLNSKAIFYYFSNTFSDNKIVFPKVKRSQILELPIKQISLSEQQPFIEKAETMLQKNKELQTIKINVIKLLQSQYVGININTKLNNWNELTFKDFCKELEKQKIKLSISEKAELMQYFEQEQTKANTIQQTINQTDKEIDQMIYKLYELTDEEIAIVENN